MELPRGAGRVDADVVDGAHTAVVALLAGLRRVLAAALRVAGFDRAEVTVFAHVRLVVRSLVDESVAVVVRAIAFFELAMGNAEECCVVAWLLHAIERVRAIRDARLGAELLAEVVRNAQAAVAVVVRRAGRTELSGQRSDAIFRTRQVVVRERARVLFRQRHFACPAVRAEHRGVRRRPRGRCVGAAAQRGEDQETNGRGRAGYIHGLGSPVRLRPVEKLSDFTNIVNLVR